MARRVVETKAISFDQEKLQILVVYEEGKTKEEIRKENPYCKKHGVLYKASGAYEFK
ncbi:hypothetical protein ABE096_14095 [Robertmurraya massiliosenegalensis]|uniref:hypothetical protein n=1 Tax=Robertmurraya TaxID=2837507 RepID=UPI0039A457AA